MVSIINDIMLYMANSPSPQSATAAMVSAEVIDANSLVSLGSSDLVRFWVLGLDGVIEGGVV